MSVHNKAITNIIRYGSPNPSIFKRLTTSLFGNSLFFMPNSNKINNQFHALYHYEKANQRELLESGYAKNPTIYACVNLIARKASLATWKVYKVKSKATHNRLKAIQNQPFSIKRELEVNILKNEALEEIANHPLNEILNAPNPQQGQSEYMENLIGMKLVTGNAYEYAQFSDEDKKNIQNFWVLPSQAVEILTNDYGTYPMHELGYQLNVGGKVIQFEPKEICHNKYWSPYFYGDGSHLYGFSPLQSAWVSTLQDNNAKEASIEQLMNRGVRGIFTIESDKITEYAQFKEVKADLHTEYAQNSKNYKDKIMPLFGKGQWHHVGLSIADLSIMEISKWTQKDIANVFGINDVLLNNDTSSTYNNKQQASKDLITQVVFPILNSIRDARNRKLKAYGDWNPTGENLIVDYDPTIYTELFEDVWDMAKNMRDVGAYTDNEIRIATNYEPLNNHIHDEVWKRTNEIPISLINENTYGQRNANQGAENEAKNG